MKFANFDLGAMARWNPNWKNITFFLLILFLSIFARAWEFRSLPPGLHQDEASIGVEAFSLLHYGVDRNNISFPVHFIAWGSGQNALYGYVLIPFVWLFGLTPTTVRIPIFISGIASLPLIYLTAKRLWNEQFGLLAMFFIAISPWHILLSRWGLESNLLPFTFLVGFTCLLYSKDKPYLFYAAMAFFALSFYCYGTAYATIPIFLLLAFPIIFRSRWLEKRPLLIGFSLFVLISIPIGLFIVINTFKLQPIHIGLFTIPRMPATQTRYEYLGAIYREGFFSSILLNSKIFVRVLLTQTDDKLRNTVDPYGYFYLVTFPFALLGIYQMFREKNSSYRPERMLLLAWLFAGFVLGFLQPVNLNRINFLLMPLILMIAYFVYWVAARYRYALQMSIIFLITAFAFFTRDYHAPEYREEAEKEFFTGFLPAVQSALAIPGVPVCITTEKLQEPFIYVLFADPPNPGDYLDTMVYEDSHAQIRQVEKMMRYTFGLENCLDTPETVYVLFRTERPPRGAKFFEIETFNRYRVYFPKQ